MEKVFKQIFKSIRNEQGIIQKEKFDLDLLFPVFDTGNIKSKSNFSFLNNSLPINTLENLFKDLLHKEDRLYSDEWIRQGY